MTFYSYDEMPTREVDYGPADDQLCGDCGALLGEEPHASDCLNAEDE